MKYLKILGLAAVAAAALTAFVGATSASATVLCNTTETSNCAASGHAYGKGTEIIATSTNTKLTTTSANVACQHSEVKGKTKNAGSSTETVEGPVETLTFTVCDHTVAVKTKGTLEVHWISGTDNGTLTSKGAAVTVLIGVSCTYGTSASGTDLGTVTDSTQTVDISATVELKEGSFLCPTTGIWEGTYTINGPSPLSIATS